jgi:hypothetical protein
MEQFIEIITKPDNIPISFMVIVVIFFTALTLWQAIRNDRLLKQGRKEDIMEQMRE